MKEIGIYIHIPFCKRKCYYCDFCSFEANKTQENQYIEALLSEIKNFKIECKTIVKTVYIGGGTPSTIDENFIERIITELKNKFNIDKNAEITIEVNPGTANYNKLSCYKKIGINRLSIGLQSTNDKLLSTIGRIHTYKEFENVYKMARDVGFNNINVDLMIGLPTQTIKDVEDSLNNIINKNPEHISVYSLILEDDTKLKALVENKTLELLDEDTERAMYWMVKNTLESRGYKHYEISNFSKPNYQSKHNTDCWKQKEYIGFGLSAHSYYNDIRYSNTSNIKEYVKNIRNNKFEDNKNVEEIQNLSSKISEYVILQLRMIDGMDIEEANKKFNIDIKSRYEKELHKLQKNELISVGNKNIKLTKKGINFANIVWSEFL